MVRLHDVIAPSIHFGNAVLALGTLQYSVMLQIPAQTDRHTFAVCLQRPLEVYLAGRYAFAALKHKYAANADTADRQTTGHKFC